VLLSVATSNKKAMYDACLKAKKIAVGEWLMQQSSLTQLAVSLLDICGNHCTWEHVLQGLLGGCALQLALPACSNTCSEGPSLLCH
jgi:hypothetical protein